MAVAIISLHWSPLKEKLHIKQKKYLILKKKMFFYFIIVYKLTIHILKFTGEFVYHSVSLNTKVIT